MTNDTPAAPCRIVALDATGDPAELRALFGREFRVVDAAVTPPPARRVWLRQGLGKGSAVRLAEEDPAKLSRHLAKAAGHLRHEDRRVLLVTHLAVEDRLLAMAKELDPTREWAVAHHSAARGINAYTDFDACLVVGTMTPNRAELVDTELALFGGDQAARDKWFSDLGRRDLIQSTARVRPVLSPKTVVILGKDWPVESLGQPSFTLDGRRKGSSSQAEEEAYRRLRALVEEFGFVFSEMAHVVGVFRGEDRNHAQDWQERIAPLIGDKTLFAIAPTLIRKCLISVGAMDQGVFKPIVLAHRGHAWPRLMARLAEETGLPLLEYHPRLAHGGAPAQAAVGYLSTVREFCDSYSLPWNPDLWAGEESAPLRTITYQLDPEPEEDPALAAEREEILKAIFTPWTEEQEQSIIKLDFRGCSNSSIIL